MPVAEPSVSHVVLRFISSVQVQNHPTSCLWPFFSTLVLLLFFPFLKLKASEIWQHWRHIRQCRKNIITPPPPSRSYVLLNVTVHQNQLCANILDEVRFAFTDDAQTRSTIVLPLVMLIELIGNKSDLSPAFGLINWHGRWAKAPGIFMYAKELFQECGHGRGPLYHHIPADNCLLLLLPGVNTAACVCLDKKCVWNHKTQPLFRFPKNHICGCKNQTHTMTHNQILNWGCPNIVKTHEKNPSI